MTQAMADPAAVRRVRRAHLTATVLVAAVSAAALLLVFLLYAGDLPDRIATHFDLSGQPNDDMARGGALALFGLVGIGVPAVLIAVFGAAQWWRGEWARAFAGFLAGFSVWLSALFCGLVVANRGAAVPEEVTLDPWLMLGGLVLGLVVGIIVALVVPRGIPHDAPEAVTPVALAPTERASWFGRAQLGRLPVLALAASVLVLVIATVASGIWWLWLIAALVALLVVAVTSFVVTVDASGVTWRSAIGLPRGHIPLSEVTDAAVVEMSPSDFGGFGLRMTPGGLGLITRRGTALQVTHGKRRFVATVDDAATGAGLLLGYLEAGHRR
ncbi:DUF1648 domain-containing protein [Ornithinimicrobium sp. F0845]|uniref:DUF1648 domain-containing protein n=1 Tax=Ornithinimicrobium sp. F0845 TaxID=2926412 RepID=UPI001FF295F5|nr:DUF1648 domain-containing protein [Ornithinimicrobium sp. F0845]MCK0113961.1 DUF1648 domain-containing protein [Ornithinimicrobium sp. F0845]